MLATLLNNGFLFVAVLVAGIAWLTCKRLRCSVTKFSIIYKFGTASIVLGTLIDALARTGTMLIPPELALSSVQVGVTIIILMYLGSSIHTLRK